MGKFLHLGAGITSEPSPFINGRYKVEDKSAFIQADHHPFSVCPPPNVLQMSTASSLLLPGRGSVYIYSINTQTGIISQPLLSPPLTLSRLCLCSTSGHNFCQAICVWCCTTSPVCISISGNTPHTSVYDALFIHFRLECWYSFFCCGVISFKISCPLQENMSAILWACGMTDSLLLHPSARSSILICLSCLIQRTMFSVSRLSRKWPFDYWNVSQNLLFKKNKEHVKSFINITWLKYYIYMGNMILAAFDHTLHYRHDVTLSVTHLTFVVGRLCLHSAAVRPLLN